MKWYAPASVPLIERRSIGGLHSSSEGKPHRAGSEATHARTGFGEGTLTLNRLGYRTGPGNSWSETRVKNLRLYNHIPVFVKGGDRPWGTMSEAADKLNVGMSVIRTMIKHRILAARQIGKGAPWMIQCEDLQCSKVQNYLRGARAGKVGPTRG